MQVNNRQFSDIWYKLPNIAMELARVEGNNLKRESPERRREILAAVLRVLREQGISGASTARIAAQANCSKETIYNWFGDRAGLFAALISEQSKAVNVMLAGSIEKHAEHSVDVKADLTNFAAALLDLLTGEASLLINRAAIGEIGNGNKLAATLLTKGRGKTSPMVINLLEQARDQGLMEFDDSSEVFSIFFGLIIADRQIRTLLGDEAARPDGKDMRQLAEKAVSRLFLIFGP